MQLYLIPGLGFTVSLQFIYALSQMVHQVTLGI